MRKFFTRLFFGKATVGFEDFAAELKKVAKGKYCSIQVNKTMYGDGRSEYEFTAYIDSKGIARGGTPKEAIKNLMEKQETVKEVIG